jgi:hypothetical protein
MAPADQGLDTDDLARFQREDRLEVHLELAAVQRGVQIRFQLGADLHFQLDHVIVLEADAAAAFLGVL